MSRTIEHWPEYVTEAVCLGIFMISAAAFATLLNHPDSPLAAAIASPTLRRVPMGLAMGLTAIAIIYSPPGKRSGAHMNPAVTLSFLWLGRIRPADAVGYVAAQFTGGWLGILAATAMLGGRPAHPAVNFVATAPGPAGAGPALLAESVISFVLMSTVLVMSSRRRTMPFTGIAAGSLVAIFIIVEDPLSGMSMNPARSLGPALLGGSTEALWIYFAGPLAGMLAAAELFLRWHPAPAVGCAKLAHPADGPCVFGCGAAAPTTAVKEAAA